MMKLLPLTLLLLAGFSLSMLASYLQHRYYLRVVNALARDYRRCGYVLATGRRKGRLRGAIAVLVVRRDDPARIERAMVMSGSTVLARFRERSELAGRADEARLADCPAVVRAAIEDALRRAREVASRDRVTAGSEAASGSALGTAAAVPRRPGARSMARQAAGTRR